MTIAIIVIVALAALAMLIRTQRLKKIDRAAGVTDRLADWRLTPTELLVGNNNNTCQRHPVAHLQAEFQTSGGINRDTGRYTMTRFALLGPFALAAKKNRGRRLDDRQGHLTVTGPQTALLKTVPASMLTRAQAFALRLNQLQRAATIGGSREPGQYGGRPAR